MNIGLYFGSFNPVHNGHLIIANYIAHNYTLDQVWLVVSPHNPLKSQKSLLNEYDRLHFVKVAIEGEKKLRASNIEFQLPKPSYTIDTLTYLQEKYKEHTFSLIMGSDSYTNLPKWKSYESILTNYTLYVYPRPTFNIENVGKKVTLVNAPLLDISATVIRKMIQEKKPIKYWVPDAVLDEIEKINAYAK